MVNNVNIWQEKLKLDLELLKILILASETEATLKRWRSLWSIEALKARATTLPEPDTEIKEALDPYREEGKKLSERIVNKQVDLSSWGDRLNEITRDAHLVATKKGKRGVLTEQDFQRLTEAGKEIHAPAVKNFADTIGTMSPKQIMARTDLYPVNAMGSYYRAEKERHLEDGYTLAKRTLGSCSRHCPECEAHQSDWTAIEDVVPPGDDCRCGGRCCCIIYYRK